MLDTFVALPPRFPALLWSPYLWLILGRLTLPGQPLRARLAQFRERERGTCTRSLPRRHGRRRNRSAPQVPLSLRHRLLLLRYDGQYIHQVSPVDSGGRQTSIARTPSPRVSLRRICFRACVYARSGCAEDGISRWCGRRYQQCEGRSQLAGWTGLSLTG